MKEVCNVCKKNIKEGEEWYCESCEEPHHTRCSGEEGGDYGEYPSETAYSICKVCCKNTPIPKKARKE